MRVIEKFLTLLLVENIIIHSNLEKNGKGCLKGVHQS
jgi:hypothetical protein